MHVRNKARAQAIGDAYRSGMTLHEVRKAFNVSPAVAWQSVAWCALGGLVNRKPGDWAAQVDRMITESKADRTYPYQHNDA
jgi:hypothetical protein